MDEHLLKEREEKIAETIKLNSNWLIYIALALITWLSIFIRTKPLPGLKDITTGTWTLGPDLDPFLFLRWAEDIVQNGSLYAIDTMRYVPLGFDTTKELLLHPYLIVWFHKLAVIFGSESVTHSAVLYPVFMFALSVIAFFFLVREIFSERLGEKYSAIIALVSCLFYVVIPSLLPRTIAGIPEKEASSFVFMFLALYWFIVSWRSSSIKRVLSFAFLSALATTAMALVWGGYVYLFVTIALASFIGLFTGQFTKEKAYSYAFWLLASSFMMWPFSPERYNLINLIKSTTTGVAFFVLGVIIIDYLISYSKSKNFIPQKYLDKTKNIPQPVLATIITIILGLLLLTLFPTPHLDAVLDKARSVFSTLVKPVTDRLGVTVAENRQPYFDEWSGSFGPEIKGVPLFFWLFFVGSIYLFSLLVKGFALKEKIALISSYTFFLIAIVFSRYDANKLLNGTNSVSLMLYALGFIVLIGVVGRIYYQHFKEGNYSAFSSLDFGLLVLFSLFFFSIITARGAIRLIMVLGIPTAVIVAFFMVKTFLDAIKSKEESSKIIAWFIAAVVIIAGVFSAYQFYLTSSSTAQGYIPSIYTQQWQKAMSWVRDSTPQNAVFAHWWDYGYWVQSIGKRATVLDGGNAIAYWNHLMGRLVLTGPDEKEALSFLYTHNATHLLIDSSDLGKYPAFSSIGSDANYDRWSSIPVFFKDSSQSREAKNATIFAYGGQQIGVEDDIKFVDNNTNIFLPRGKAGFLGAILKIDLAGKLVEQPLGVFIYKNQQYRLPLRYAYDTEFRDFGKGVESGIFLFPALNPSGSSYSLDLNGAMIYLSERTVHSQLAKLYLFRQPSAYIKEVHNEDDFLVAQVKQQNSFDSHFVYYQGVRGPITIWEISYPANQSSNRAYLSESYADASVAQATQWS